MEAAGGGPQEARAGGDLLVAEGPRAQVTAEVCSTEKPGMESS